MTHMTETIAPERSQRLLQHIYASQPKPAIVLCSSRCINIFSTSKQNWRSLSEERWNLFKKSQANVVAPPLTLQKFHRTLAVHVWKWPLGLNPHLSMRANVPFKNKTEIKICSVITFKNGFELFETKYLFFQNCPDISGLQSAVHFGVTGKYCNLNYNQTWLMSLIIQ